MTLRVSGIRSLTAGVALLGLTLVPLSSPERVAGQVQVTPPDTLLPDTIPVDSTALRIQQQLLGLAKPPGVDSVYFLPDSLMPDSLREYMEARRGQGRLGGGGGSRETARAPGSGMSGGDSILMALKELQGYTLTEYQSLGADFGAADRQLILLGQPGAQAQIIADGQELTADSLFYDEEKGKVWSVGSEAMFHPEGGDPVNSRVIVFDLNEERGTALDAKTTYSGGMGEWIVHGDLTSVNDTASWGNHLMFTSCELDEPHYHFASNNVKIVRGNLLVARPVKLYFADVPVAWLPFMVQNMDQGRSSGLLTPTFSINDIVRTSAGYSRRLSNLGFYWAASEYFDATVFLDWWSGEHLALTGSTRFNWAKKFLSGNASYREFWRESGDRQRAINGNGSWEMSERTKLRFRGSYTSSSQLVRQTSFNPMEAVQTIDSEGGLSHRFDFGNLTLSANRKQHLADDRVDMTLPNLSFSLSPLTFLKASPNQARFYNNMTFSGSARFRRNTTDRQEQPDTAVWRSSLADQMNTDASLSGSLNLGSLSLGGSMDFRESIVMEVPGVDYPDGTLGPGFIPFQDQATATAGWNASLGYQQNLVGSTSITPSLSISSELMRADTMALATSFVSGPTRLSAGVSLRTEIYGFFGGFGEFDAIRHKMSPSFDFSYSPRVSSTDLQAEVFGRQESRPQRTLRISLNQTWEARRKEDPNAAASGNPALPGGVRPETPLDSLGAPLMGPDSLGLGPDSLGLLPLPGDSLQGPSSAQNAQKVTLLALKTTAISYDFEEASEREDWLWGVTNSVITNTLSSDYLRGLNVTIAHDLFDEDATATGVGGGSGSGRKFAPHLSSLNFGFSLDGKSLPFRLLSRLLGSGDEDSSTAASVQDPATAGENPLDNPFAPALTDETSIIPGASDPSPRSRTRGGSSRGGGWRANLRFSMQRPRGDVGTANQMIRGTLNFPLTENWDASWRTGYNLIDGTFSDHVIQLTRNLHRWEAHFDFNKSATGNWQFRFEVALTDQEDLHFDYSQRSYTDSSGGRRY